MIFYIENIVEEARDFEWELYQDEETHEMYIGRKDVGVRLKLDRRLRNRPITINHSKISIYGPAKLVNDHHNMNPIIYYTIDESTENTYAIITLGSEFKLLRYRWYHDTEILSVFKTKENDMQGCIAQIKSLDEEDFRFGELKVYSSKKNKFLSITLSFSKNRKIIRLVEEITDEEDIDALMRIQRIYKNPLRFKPVLTKPVTKVYITTMDKKDELKKILLNYPYIRPKIYTIEESDKDNVDKLSEQLSIIRESKNRAITEYGVKIPFDVICNLKILYIFMMEQTTDIMKITCVKSI